MAKRYASAMEPSGALLPELEDDIKLVRSTYTHEDVDVEPGSRELTPDTMGAADEAFWGCVSEQTMPDLQLESTRPRPPRLLCSAHAVVLQYCGGHRYRS